MLPTAMIKMKGCIEKSAEIMGSMNKLVNVKEISETMRDMAREMERVRTAASGAVVVFFCC